MKKYPDKNLFLMKHVDTNSFKVKHFENEFFSNEETFSR